VEQERLGRWLEESWVRELTCLLVLLLTWQVHSCDTIPAMKVALVKLGDRLGSDPEYFRKVYQYTFDFARNEGQRSLGQVFFYRSKDLLTQMTDTV
jgi:DCN1-like protein 1/2